MKKNNDMVEFLSWISQVGLLIDKLPDESRSDWEVRSSINTLGFIACAENKSIGFSEEVIVLNGITDDDRDNFLRFALDVGDMIQTMTEKEEVA